MTAAQEDKVIACWEDHEDFPIFGNRDQKKTFVVKESTAQDDNLLTMWRPHPDFPREADRETQLDWSAKRMMARMRELGPTICPIIEEDSSAKEECSDGDTQSEKLEYKGKGVRDEDILIAGCGRGAEEDNVAAAVEGVNRSPPTAKKERRRESGGELSAEPRRRVRRSRRASEFDNLIERIRSGSATKVQIIRPDESAGLDEDVEAVIDACIENPGVSIVELQATPLCAMGGLAMRAVVRLVRSMRSGGSRLAFLGLTNTMLTDEAAGWIAGALDILPARDPTAEPETIEMLQISLPDMVRRQLKTAGQRAGVHVLLSRPNGPALRS